ncbi:MAG: hypothetical protein H6905_06105 [Hyphomicrobiales bacterium]|nr:hypothetical protein [Hyphomicrobiales bacterium]
MRILLTFASLLICIGSFNSIANAADLDTKQLLGKWVINNTTCSDPASEYLYFRDTGLVDSVEGGKAEAAGFWEIRDGLIVLNVIATPALFHKDLTHLEGQYFSYRINIVPFNISPDSFEGVGVIGEQVRRATFTRCDKS